MPRNSCLKLPPARARLIRVACSALAGFVIVLGASRACADVDVQGTSASVHVVANNAKISEVLKSLTEALENFRCKETASLDDMISGNYKGPVEDVLRRILRGYDYVITTKGAAMDILVVGKSAGAPASVPASATVAPVAEAPSSAARIPPAFAAPLPIGWSPALVRGR